MRAIVRAIRRRIAFKLTLTLVGFVGVSMVAAGFFLNHALEEFAVESLEQRLASVAGVVEDEARGLLRGIGAPAAVQAFVLRVARPTGARVTLIAADGRVVGESDRRAEDD